MIDARYFLLNVLGLTVGTYLIRASFITFSSRMKISPQVRDLFTYIPASILPALIIPSAFYHQGSIDWLLHKERFFILIIASVACYFVRNTLFVISLGLALLYLVTHLIG